MLLVLFNVWLTLGVLIYRNSWCDPFKTWQKGYTFNPTANLTDDQAKLVLGGTSPNCLIAHLTNTNYANHQFYNLQGNTYFGQNNPALLTSIPSYGLAQPHQQNFGGQAQDRASAMLFPAFMIYHSDSNNVAFIPSLFNLCGVLLDRAHAI